MDVEQGSTPSPRGMGPRRLRRFKPGTRMISGAITEDDVLPEALRHLSRAKKLARRASEAPRNATVAGWVSI